MKTTITYRFPEKCQDAGALRMVSMNFPHGLVYEIMGDSMIAYTRTNGILSIDKRNIKAFAAELIDIAETWEDVST